MVDFKGNFLVASSWEEGGIILGTNIFIIFFIARKDICDLDFALGAFLRKLPYAPRVLQMNSFPWVFL